MKIVIVCFANYCRSPVAEYLLKEDYKDIEFFSAGMDPYPDSNMDKRSISFLEGMGIKNITHNPRKITKEMIEACDFILAMDLKILQALNLKFPQYSKKFKIFSYRETSVDLSDPFKNDLKKYNEIMTNIKYLCKNFLQRFSIRLTDQ